jgi:hypothetical protein
VAVGPGLPDGDSSPRSALRRANGFLQVAPFAVPEQMRRAGLIGRIKGQMRPHDGNSAILLTGLLGMAAIIVIDTVLLMAFKHFGFLTAASEAVAVLSTVGPAPDSGGYPWYQVFAIAAMLSAIIFLAVFTAGMVETWCRGVTWVLSAAASCRGPDMSSSSASGRSGTGCARSCGVWVWP